jgi:diguanylate cyclase (GGDEF)-like protein/PAS domain S-box-containing protein
MDRIGSGASGGADGPDDGPWRLFETLVAAVDQAFDSIIVTDTDLDPPGPLIVYANPAFCRMTGYSQEDVVGATPRILHGPDTDRRVLDRMRSDLSEHGSFQGQAINYRRDGAMFTMEWSISTVRDDDGAARYYVSVQRDVTTFHRLLEDAEHLARTDPLTGISNRRSFDAHLARVLADPASRERAGLIAIGGDRFKAVNDNYGHAAGDAVLQEVARRLRLVVRDTDIIARTGGEEFAILLAGASCPADVSDVAEKVRASLSAEPVVAGSLLLQVTASFGVAHVATSGSDAGHLVADADRALYRSKVAGRDRVTVAAPDRRI